MIQKVKIEDNCGSEFPCVTEHAFFVSKALGSASFILSPTDSFATQLSNYHSRIKSANLSIPHV